MNIHLTQAQARTVAGIAEREGELSVHQLAHDNPTAPAEDVYVTPVAAANGYRIAADGKVGAIRDTISSRA